MNYNEKSVLKAAASLTSGDSLGWKAQDLQQQLRAEGLRVDQVALSLLQLRDEGLVATEPTHGDPLDGEFAFRLTDAGRAVAARIR